MLEYSFLIRALAAASLSSLSLALFSPFVTLRRISYMGEALSHIAFAGIALAILAGWNMQFTAMLVVVGVSLAISWLSRRQRLEEANAITIFLSVSMAIGIILISLNKGYTFDLASYLFGNVLLANSTDLWLLGAAAVLNLAFILGLYKELFYYAYNPELASFYRLHAGLVNRLFMILLAVNIVINVRAAGIILVSAQLILPAAAAFNLVDRLDRALVFCVVFSLLASFGGFALSWWLNLPTGASVVVLEFVMYLLSLLPRAFRRDGC